MKELFWPVMSLWRIYNNTIITLLNISHFLPRVYGYKIQSSRVLHVYLVSAIFVLNCESLQSCWNYIDLLFLLFPPLPLSLPSVLFILIAMSGKTEFSDESHNGTFSKIAMILSDRERLSGRMGWLFATGCGELVKISDELSCSWPIF